MNHELLRVLAEHERATTDALRTYLSYDERNLMQREQFAWLQERRERAVYWLERALELALVEDERDG